MDFESSVELGNGEAERVPLLADASGDKAVSCRRISPKTTTKLIRRIKALTLRLLPMQVELESITEPTSDIITKEVVEAFEAAAGDFIDALPYCLLEARRSFRKEAYDNPADFEEALGRKAACEAIARKVVARAPLERQHLLLCSRYSRIESDGDVSLQSSALETAVDQDATFFLSSSEAQAVTQALWKGHLVQTYDVDGHATFGVWAQAGKGGFLRHLDPNRLAVPCFQNFFRIALWILFIIAYTWALQTPERAAGPEDVVLYVQAAGYLLENISKVYKVASYDAIGFWTYIDAAIWCILGVALGFRVADTASPAEDIHYRQRSFMILSCAAPLVWSKALQIFDTFTFFSVLQIVVARMMRESAVFFALLAFISIGFAQSLTGLDVADGRDATVPVLRTLIEAILGDPSFDQYAEGTVESPYGLILYYIFSFLTLVILVNLLVALFSSAYDQVTGDSISFAMTAFTRKVVSTLRAPDQFVYVAPFNLIEILILPLEFVLSRESYAQLNRWLMTALFFPPLCVIAAYESLWDARKVRQQRERLEQPDDDYDENPDADAQDEGKLSKVQFDDLVKKFPDLTASVSSVTLKEVRALRKELKSLREEVTQSAKVKKEEA